MVAAADSSKKSPAMPAYSEPLKAPLLKQTALDKDPATDQATTRWPWRIGLLLAVLLGIVIGAGGAVATSHLRGRAARSGLWRWPVPQDATWIPQMVSLPRQGERKQIKVDGRSVWVYTPAGAAAGPLPAVVVLHGSYDTALGIAGTSQFERVADWSATGFLAVFPEMKKAGGVSWGEHSEDAFWRSVIDKVHEVHPVDRRQVFVAGHSNGGTMALLLQNNMPDVFCAAGVVEAGVGGQAGWRNESQGRPTMIVWNHNDPVLAEFGGETLYHQTLSKLRRHDPNTDIWAPAWETPLTSIAGMGYKSDVLYASRQVWPAVGLQPEVQVVSWASVEPTHHWLGPRQLPGVRVDASVLLWEFFRSVASKPAGGAA